MCEYDTSSSTESRIQSLKRRYESSHSSQELARYSVDWLRSQSSFVVLSCLDRLRHAEDPLAELCSIASNERESQLPPAIAPEGNILTMSPSLNSMLDFELSLSHPSSFPWLSDLPPALHNECPPDLEALGNSSCVHIFPWLQLAYI